MQREVNQQWNPNYCTEREKHPEKVHMWGCFSGYGLGELFLFEENLDAPLMLKILKDHLLKSADRLFPPGQWWFHMVHYTKMSAIIQYRIPMLIPANHQHVIVLHLIHQPTLRG